MFKWFWTTFSLGAPERYFVVSSGGNELSNVSSFIILLSGEGLTSFNKDNSTNFPGD